MEGSGKKKRRKRKKKFFFPFSHPLFFSLFFSSGIFLFLSSLLSLMVLLYILMLVCNTFVHHTKHLRRFLDRYVSEGWKLLCSTLFSSFFFFLFFLYIKCSFNRFASLHEWSNDVIYLQLNKYIHVCVCRILYWNILFYLFSIEFNYFFIIKLIYFIGDYFLMGFISYIQLFSFVYLYCYLVEYFV